MIITDTFKRGIILKDRVYIPDHDDRTAMLVELKIDNNEDFVCALLTPPDKNIFAPVSEWKYRVGQDILPDWYVPEVGEKRMREAVTKWAKERIHIGEKIDTINSGTHWIKDCKIGTICGSAKIKTICGSAEVESIRGSAEVGSIRGSANVDNICGSAKVTYIFDSANVKYICDSAEVGTICGSATVKYICGTAIVDNIFDSATVKYIRDAATVKRICNSVTIKCIYDSAIVKDISDSVTVEMLEEPKDDKYWYAILRDEGDGDWGSGSFDLEEAIQMCINADFTQIAVIDGNYDEDGNEHSDTICVDLLFRGADFDTDYVRTVEYYKYSDQDGDGYYVAGQGDPVGHGLGFSSFYALEDYFNNRNGNCKFVEVEVPRANRD